jgi:hypothetical protein
VLSCCCGVRARLMGLPYWPLQYPRLAEWVWMPEVVSLQLERQTTALCAAV